MKNYLKSPVRKAFMALSLTLFIASCSSDDGSIFETPDIPDQTDPNGDPIEVATLVFNEALPSSNIITAEASGAVGTSVPGRVVYTSSDLTQRRMYITQNISGQGEMPFNNFQLGDTELTKALKADGSIDLDGATKKEIDFTFNLPVPNIVNGSIVYKFWTTTGKGDFRDASKRLALGIGTITVTVGNGTNPSAAVREFTGVKLYAPDVNGNSKTFFSLLDGTAYIVYDQNFEENNESELEQAEKRAFWDFGYYYGAAGISTDQHASLASTNAYDEVFGFPVKGLQPLPGEEDIANETLNKTYFAISLLTTAEFDGIALSGDLDSIMQSSSQKVTNLSIGDIIEFVDNYGKKGLIKITDIKPGYAPTTDYIQFDLKVQP